MRATFLTLCLGFASLVLLGGCDLFDRTDGCLIEGTGRVVLSETGQPIAGLGISLQAANILSPVVASARTDGEGRFVIRYDATRPGGTAVTTTGYTLTINDEPYDNRYGVYVDVINEAANCSVDLGTVQLSAQTVP